MSELRKAQEARMKAKIDQVRQEYGDAIVDLLNEKNARLLQGKGEISIEPIIEHTNVRWVLSWTEQEKISFDLNVVIGIEDDGKQARVGRVWVHRHASTPLDFDGHTPTTRMRRLTGLSIREIREAIEQEWG
jgi:hypothetical protein